MLEGRAATTHDRVEPDARQRLVAVEDLLELGVRELDVEEEIFVLLDLVLGLRLGVVGARVLPVEPGGLARVEVGVLPIERY